jgi:hypothetical protein
MRIYKLAKVTIVVLGILVGGLVFAGTPVSAAMPTVTIAPVVEVEGVSAVTPFDGVLEGQINTEQQQTSYFYEYSSEKDEVEHGEGMSIGGGSLPGTAEPQAANSADIGGSLMPGTVYYYRLVATNETGTSTGGIQEFMTEALQAPSVLEESAQAVEQGTVSVSALIDPEFQAAVCKAFQYSSDASYRPGVYGSEVPCAAADLGSGPEPAGSSATLTGLAPNTVYHYRALAENATGLGEGPDQTFLTLPSPPVVNTGGVSAVTADGATVTGMVNPDNAGHGEQDDTKYYFQYGQDQSYAQRTFPETEAVGEGTTPLQETATLNGLAPGHTYHYRIVASNDNDAMPQVAYGRDETFTTAGSQPLPLAGSPETVTETMAPAPAATTFPDLTKLVPVPQAKEPGASKPRVKSLTRAQKLARALRACAVKPKRARALCRRAARKRYAVSKSATTRSHR